jgi:hypothetical protein
MDKIDLLYILKENTDWQNNEIRYSIRSAEKNLEQMGNVFIIGSCPVFVNKEKITFVEYPDKDHNKLVNAINKIEEACRDCRLSERFILMNDDFFIMKPVSEVKNYSRGTMEETKARHRSKTGYYYRAICDTLDFLKEMGYENPIDYETHTPMIFEKTKFLKAVKEMKRYRKGFVFRSVYGNMFEVPCEKRPDVKIYSILNIKKIGDNDMISTSDTIVLHPKFQDIMRTLFPKISILENNMTRFYSTKVIKLNGQIFNAGDLITQKLSPEEIKKFNIKIVKKPNT